MNEPKLNVSETMSDIPAVTELQWNEDFDDEDNSIWEAASPYHDDGTPFVWRIKPRLFNNKIEWYAAHDDELGGDDDFWPTLDEAKATVLELHRLVLSELQDQ